MQLYPSCPSNRIQEANRQLSFAQNIPPIVSQYPYHIIDLSVRMRPVVEEIDTARKRKPEIELLQFELSC